MKLFIKASLICISVWGVVFVQTSEAQNKVKPSLERQIKRKGPDLRTLPFIHFTSGGWVRADTLTYGVLTTCEVAGRVFSCIEDEKARYGEQLKQVEQDLAFVLKKKKGN